MRVRVGGLINVIEVAPVRNEKEKKKGKRETHELKEVRTTAVVLRFRMLS